jgi:hypothetical protein
VVASVRVGRPRLSPEARRLDHCDAFFLTLDTPKTSPQRYFQPPVLVPMCVSGPCATQPCSNYTTVWGSYNTWVFRGSRACSQGGVVHRAYVLLVCRKFWFSDQGAIPPGTSRTASDAGLDEAASPPIQRHAASSQIPGARLSTSEYQGHGVDEPEAVQQAVVNSLQQQQQHPLQVQVVQCSICMDTAVDPVTTPCNHVFCDGHEHCRGLRGLARHSADEIVCPCCREDLLPFCIER